jgi:hypothetical protein
VAANLLQLQGLRILPIGVGVILIEVWSILPVNHHQTLAVPWIILGLGALVYWRIDRYYTRQFGRVRQTNRLRWKEIILMILGGILGLAGFWVDVTFKWRVSAVGLVIVAGMIADYLRVNWRDDWQEFWFYPALAVGILIVDVLPLPVGPAFWPSLGIRSAMDGILIVTGIGMIILGVLSHGYLLRILPLKQDVQP